MDDVSHPNRRLVLAKLRIAFPERDAAKEALIALNRYQGEASDLVRLAILKLSERKLWKLRELVSAARKDYRDVLFPAQSPELYRELQRGHGDLRWWSRKVPMKQASAKKAAASERKAEAMRKRDMKQWLDWLSSEEDP